MEGVDHDGLLKAFEIDNATFLGGIESVVFDNEPGAATAKILLSLSS